MSRDRLARWNPVNPDDLSYHLKRQSDAHRTFMIRALTPVGDHDMVGRVNVTNVVRGRSQSATIGYDAYDPYAGRGLFAQGLALVVDLALADEPSGMGLHRLEAGVQPGNVRSAGMLRSLGFRRRGSWPDFLWLPDESGADDWRDHVCYGITRAEWPPAGHPERVPSRPVVVLTAASADQADAVARELVVPVLPADAILALADPRLLGRLLGLAHGGAVLHGTLTPETVDRLIESAGLVRQRVLVRDTPLGGEPDGPVGVALAAIAAAAGA